MTQPSDPVEQAWESARHAPGLDPGVWRADPYLALIRREDFGDHSEFGWELDPEASPPRALYWRNNIPRGQSAPVIFSFFPPLGLNTGNIAW